MTMVGTLMKMRPVSALDIPPGSTVALGTGGYHVMLTGLRQPLAVGDKVPLTLTFEKAGAARRVGLCRGAESLAPISTPALRIGIDNDGRSHGCTAMSSAYPAVDVAAGAPGRRAGAGASSPRAIVAWLLVCCALVFAMVVVGGVTRLTHSGLSITEWQPIVGTLPPLSRRRLERCVREVPGDAGIPRRQPRHDARRVQAHLLVGILPSAARPRDRRRVPRAVPVVPASPPHPARLRVAAARHLRARRAAGRVGWYMVKSGLVDDPRVSPVPPHRASRPRVRDLRGDAVDRAVARVSAPRRCVVRRRSRRAPLCVRRRGAGVRDGAARRIRRRHSRRLRVQHVSADERARRAAGDPDARAVVEEFLLEHGDGAVRPPGDRAGCSR